MRISLYTSRRFIRIALLVSVGVLIQGCASHITQPMPQFNWQPQGQEAPQKINIALVNPAYKTDSSYLFYKKNKYLKLFLDSMQTDLQKGLLAKGITVNGSFESFEEMTFPNKKATDLALVPDVTLMLDGKFSENDQHPLGTDGSESIKIRGAITVSGFITFTLVEPLSEQKIWIKKVNLADESENVVADLLIMPNGSLNTVYPNVDNRDAALVNALNKIYPKIMQQFWNHLNTEEIKTLKKAAKDARDLKRF